MRVADHIGRVLGSRYRLSAVIGTGASAHVFLAEDSRLGRRVAVKVLHPALADDAAFLRRFRAEARAAAALSHPNVLAVYDWGEEEDGPFIVTEFLGGGSLRAMLDRGHRLDPSQALLVGLETARGLDYAHRRGLVHRDIKPANLLFDEEGRLRIADFGLARALAEAAWTEPSGAVLGTARYAAPEQVRGVPLDGKADVYSLALVLVEAVTGRVPFAADTTVGTILARLERPLDVPEEMGPLGPLIARAGQPDREARPDATAFGAALHALAPTLASPKPLPLAGPSIFDETQVGIDRDPTELGAAEPRRRKAPAMAGGPPAPPGPPGASDPTVAIAAPATPATPAEQPEQPEELAEVEPMVPAKAGRRRRRGLRVTLAVVMALICGSAAAIVLVRVQVPSYDVPDVTTLGAGDAENRLRNIGFEVVQKKELDDRIAQGTVIRQIPAPQTPPVKLKEGQTVQLIVSDGPHPTEVPDLAGLSRAEALAALEQAFLKPGEISADNSETVEDDHVISWAPTGGARRGDTVAITLSAGPAKRTIPDLTKMSYEQAATTLEDLGLKVARDERNDDDVPNGAIIGTRPAVGNKVDKGATVTIVISRGQPTVPNIYGMSATQAKAALEAVGLKLGNVFGIAGAVFRSDPQPGARAKAGTSVNVFII